MHISTIDSPTKKTQSMSLKATNDLTLRIVGNGYFTDESLTKNKGKSLVIPSAQTNTDVYFSNGNYDIVIDNKYYITLLSYSFWSDLDTFKNRSFNVEDLAFSNSLNTLRLLYGLQGDLSTLKTSSLVDLYVFNSQNLYGDISKLSLRNIVMCAINDTKLTGTTAGFQGNTVLVFIRTNGSGVTIRTSDIKECTKLDSIIGTLSGTLGDLKNCGMLANIVVTPSNLTGDAATLPANITKLEINNVIKLTWSKRPSNYNRYCITGAIQFDNVDDVLKDMAACSVIKDVPAKVISLKGTRTSTSDEAVSKMQAEGWNIIVSPV